MAGTPNGHIEQLPSGSWRAKVYAGTDPLTGREIRFRKTCKTERAAQIELGKLLAMAQAGRQPDSDVTVAQLLDQYVSTAGWDVSTRESNLGYIRRTIKPALGSTQVRKVRGPLLDTTTPIPGRGTRTGPRRFLAEAGRLTLRVHSATKYDRSAGRAGD